MTQSPRLLRWTLGILGVVIVAFAAVFLTPWQGETARGKWTYFLNIGGLIAHVPEIEASEKARFWYGFEDNGAPAHQGVAYCSRAGEEALMGGISAYLTKEGWKPGEEGHWQRDVGQGHPRIDVQARPDDYNCKGRYELSVEEIWPTHFDTEAARIREK